MGSLALQKMIFSPLPLGLAVALLAHSGSKTAAQNVALTTPAPADAARSPPGASSTNPRGKRDGDGCEAAFEPHNENRV